MSAALALLWAGVALGAAPADSFRTAQVGEVRVVAAERELDRAVGLAELADRPAEWPGLGRVAPGPFRLVLVRDSAALDRVTHGRAPGWGAGVAFPGARTIILRADLPDLQATLRHEVAHLVLRARLRSRVPLWFDEGYAALAAGEWGRLAEWQIHLGVAFGGVPTLGDLDGQLRASAFQADRAYALAAGAVSALAARIPGGDLRPLLDRLAAGEDFDGAVRRTTGRSVPRFESEWREATRREYRGALWLVAGGWWLLGAIVVVVAWGLRRRRERPRRAALDVGWEMPQNEPIDPGGEGV
ncbi:MAG TPA: hypothetical protein VFS07_03880 [Gemmatimonadales bacterium]|nr:hypothetical protein [Gemmatimonadales bacterium]